MVTHPVPVPVSSPWLCTPGWPEGRMRWVTGLAACSSFSSWHPQQHLAQHACRQAAKHLPIASHALERGKTHETFADFLVACAGTGRSPCTRAFSSMRRIVLCITTRSIKSYLSLTQLQHQQGAPNIAYDLQGN